MALESFNGEIVRNMKDNGIMDSNMEKEFILIHMVNQEMAFGKMEKE